MGKNYFTGSPTGTPLSVDILNGDKALIYAPQFTFPLTGGLSSKQNNQKCQMPLGQE